MIIVAVNVLTIAASVSSARVGLRTNYSRSNETFHSIERDALLPLIRKRGIRIFIGEDLNVRTLA